MFWISFSVPRNLSQIVAVVIVLGLFLVLPQAGKGFEVTGVDIAPSALVIAAEKARKAGVKVNWMVADMVALPKLEAFDLVFDRGCYHHICQYNSAGYVETLRRLSHGDTRVRSWPAATPMGDAEGLLESKRRLFATISRSCSSSSGYEASVSTRAMPAPMAPRPGLFTCAEKTNNRNERDEKRRREPFFLGAVPAGNSVLVDSQRLTHDCRLSWRHK